MNEMYIYHLQKYLEKMISLESHLLILRDKNELLKDVKDIELYLYPYKIIYARENVVFRAMYENIKECKDNNYIIILENEEIHNKLLDFIKRSEGGKVKEITMQSLLECVEDELKWNEKVNQFDSADIRKKFNKLIYYRKLIKKRNINKHETNKVVLSSLLELDAISIKDEIDCYLYYRDIKDLYGGLKNLKYKNDIKKLIKDVFFEYGFLLANIAESDMFEEFERFLWVSCGLNILGRLSKENLKIIFRDEYKKLDGFVPKLNELIKFADIIERKDKKYYIQKKDWAEKLILDAEIDIPPSESDYRDMFREGTVSLVNIIEGIKIVLRDYNLEGFKKVFKYDSDNLYELNMLIKKNVCYKTTGIKKLIDWYDLLVNLFGKVEHAENYTDFISDLVGYGEWEIFYRDYLHDLQYRLSKLRYLDKQNMIEEHRYISIDKRINNILNEYRKYFAQFLEKNYDSWRDSPYGISRPLLNSDISGILDLGSQKTYIIIFDGMRYDAWEHIVRPYFEKVFAERNTKYRSSFALLPTITAVSRRAIYSDILKKHRKETSFLTKSESVKKEGQLKDIILQDKKINIFIFNMFDRDGHKATEDFFTFYDKQKKVFENSIMELLKMIKEDSNIVIASDHGLMRIDEYINMKDKEGIVSVKSRYLKTDGKLYLDGFINTKDNIALSYDNRGYFTGGGERDFYSHGGASIEEVIVPFVFARSKTVKQDPIIKEEDVPSSVYQEVLQLDQDTKLRLSFKLNEKERLILAALYEFKNKDISDRDIEKILKKETGSAGLVNAIIRRLIKKLQGDGIDVIQKFAMGDLIMYRFDYSKLEGIH
ncbi:MAG: PglZ domain-containing protein [Candidatus Alkaliphilus sp. MAG34]